VGIRLALTAICAIDCRLLDQFSEQLIVEKRGSTANPSVRKRSLSITTLRSKSSFTIVGGG